MATPISYFLEVFLKQPASSIPKGSQWAVFFEDIKPLIETIDNAYKGEPLSDRWNTSPAATSLLYEKHHTTEGIGCMFCQAISLPGEGSLPIAEGTKYNSYIRGYVGAGRNDFPVLRMAFLETNVSFTDTILRGWALATAKFGMIARPPDSGKNYRTNLRCLKFTSTPKGPEVSLAVHFQGICCVSVDDQELNYDPMTVAVKRQAQFVYHSYSVDAVTDADIYKIPKDK